MDALRCESQREAETEPAKEGVAATGQTEELGDGLVGDGWLWWLCAGLGNVAVEDVEPGRGGLD